MLRDEIELYTKLTGKDGQHTPICVIGAYLDGYEKGKEEKQTNTAEMIGEKAELGKMNELTVQTASVLEEIKAEIENHFINADNRHLNDLEYGQNQGLGIAFDIIDKHIAERSSE